MSHYPNETDGNPILCGKKSSVCSRGPVVVPDISNCLIGQKLTPSSGRHRISSFSPTSLVAHVLHVLGLRAKPKMLWIDAPGIVSTRAVVKNLKTFWDGAVVQCPGITMGGGFGILTIVPVRIIHELSVSEFDCACCPQPAGFSLLDLLPKSRLWGAWYSLFRHLETSIFLLLGGGVRALPLLES